MSAVERCLFLHLLASEDKGDALLKAVEAARQGKALNPVVHAVDPTSFRQVPGSPFAYWVSERVRRLFTELPPVEGDGRTVKQGLATADDFRFVRAWWEVAADRVVTGTPATTPEEYRKQTCAGKRWVPFAKGGAYSPYYADLHLVVNWEREGEEIRNFDKAFIRNEDFYFRPGLTWPRRTQGGLSIRAYPAGAVFGDKGPVLFADSDALPVLLALCNSRSFRGMVALQMAFGSYEVGVIQRTPIPQPGSGDRRVLDQAIRDCLEALRIPDQGNELSHAFLLPAGLAAEGDTLAALAVSWSQQCETARQRVLDRAGEIDDIAYRLYGIPPEDRAALTSSDSPAVDADRRETAEGEDPDEEKSAQAIIADDSRLLAADLVSYAVGCVLGRWDLRLATGARKPPPLPGPFATLPACSPGMLTGPDGLPLATAPAGYPLRIDADGILVDDAGHSDDIAGRVHDVLTVLWGDGAEAIEREACALLGVKDLRDYFRNPRGFFDQHISRYSMSRRKAPVYWLLQSARRSYALWFYYPRMDRDTVYKAVEQYVGPKLRGATGRLKEMKDRLTTGKDTLPRKEARDLADAVERQEDLLTELEQFRRDLQEVVDLGYQPDLDDGVVLNLAPFRKLVPWKEARARWDDLVAGKYAWSTIARRLREKGVVPSR